MLVSFLSYSCVLITNDFFFCACACNLMSRIELNFSQRKIKAEKLLSLLPDPFSQRTLFLKQLMVSPCLKSKIKKPPSTHHSHRTIILTTFHLLHVERDEKLNKWGPFAAHEKSRKRSSWWRGLKLIKNKMFSFSSRQPLFATVGVENFQRLLLCPSHRTRGIVVNMQSIITKLFRLLLMFVASFALDDGLWRVTKENNSIYFLYVFSSLQREHQHSTRWKWKYEKSSWRLPAHESANEDEDTSFLIYHWK